MSRSFFNEERYEDFMNVPTHRPAYKPVGKTYLKPMGTRDGLKVGRNNYLLGRRPAEQKRYLRGRTLFYRPFSRNHYNRNEKYSWTSRALSGVPNRGTQMLKKKGQFPVTGRDFMAKSNDKRKTLQVKV